MLCGLEEDAVFLLPKKIIARGFEVDDAGEVEQTQTAEVWHENETFLVNDAKYKASKLTSVRFPPNSGDLNPIETGER